MKPLFLSNQSELYRRTVTGLIGGLFFLLMVLPGGRIGTAIIAVLLSMAMLFEFSEIVFELPDRIEKRLVLMGGAWLLSFLNFWIPRAEYELLLSSFFCLFIYYLISAQRYEQSEPGTMRIHFKELMASAFGLLYLGFVPFFLILIRDGPLGLKWMLCFLLVVWSSDIGAYFAGLKFGKQKLYPLISPKKTVEGAAGGLILALVVNLLLKLTYFSEQSWGAVFVIPVFVGLVSQVGDLCESFLKRAFDKKDSGTLLPGHGGVLDRFDGVLFALPVMYACVRIFG